MKNKKVNKSEPTKIKDPITAKVVEQITSPSPIATLPLGSIQIQQLN